MTRTISSARPAGQTWRGLLPLLIVPLLLQLAVSFQLGKHVTERMLQRDGSVAQELLQSIVAAENSKDKLFSEPRPSIELTSFARHVASLPGTLRANIYSPDEFIRQSSDPNLIGLKFDGNPELAASLAGNIISKLEQVEAAAKPEHMALQSYSGDKLIEAYIPLLDEGKVYAVVEYYRRPAGLVDAIAGVWKAIWLSTAASCLIMLGLWLWLVRRKAQQS